MDIDMDMDMDMKDVKNMMNMMNMKLKYLMRNKRRKEAEIEYQSILDTEISENEELKKVVKENEKWDRIAELG